MAATCRICERDDVETLEEDALPALLGQVTWQSVATKYDLPNIKGLQNHMKRHYIPPPTAEEEVANALDPLIHQVAKELAEQMAYAPPEVKPFYVVAIQNLRGIKSTKPSQKDLISALKAIHEVTGMKMEQRLMLEFAKHQFGLGSGEATAALEQHADVIEVEPEVDDASGS